MRYPWLFLLIVLWFSSCKIHKITGSNDSLGNTPASTKPFVQLRNKEKTEAETVSDSADSVIAGHKAFAKRDITFYSNGHATFANIGKTYFATKIMEGRLNVYVADKPYYNAKTHSTHYVTVNYIQKSGSDNISLFNYRSVKKLILPGDVGDKYIQRFRDNCLLWTTGFFGGMAVEFRGIGISNSPNKNGPAIGNTLMLAGVCSFLTSAVELVLNKVNTVQKAVAKYNG